MIHDPIDPKHFPNLHAYLKTQAMLPWADKLTHIASLVKMDMDEKLIDLSNSKFNKSNPTTPSNKA